jgi:predicted alpha/beta superfamily hydrolase
LNIKLTHYQNLKIQGLLPRDLWVWTPRDYECKPKCRFPVIYMHDGQNLFDSKKSYTHVTWGIAETITRLSAWGFIQPAIVVGIDNTINRIGDYMPTRPFDSPEGKAFISAALNNSPQALKSLDYVADLYLQLMVEKIKPLIDEDFRTLTDR